MSGLNGRVARLEAAATDGPCPVCKGNPPMRVLDATRPTRGADVEPCAGCGGLLTVRVLRDRRGP
jgi:hypothetical protein